MTGGAGINAVSSAQSKQVGMGVQHSGMGLNGGSSKGGCSKMAAGGVLDTLVVYQFFQCVTHVPCSTFFCSHEQ